MTFFVKCDSCGAVSQAPTDRLGDPFNPSEWWSRTDKKTGKTLHACSRECRNKQGGVSVPW